MADIRDYGIIFANDVPEPREALKISEDVASYVDGIKIGIATTLRPGISLLTRIKKRTGKLIVADFKVPDIGFKRDKWEGTNARIVGALADAGADYVTCHAFPGISSIEESVETAHEKGSKVLAIPYMSHTGAELFFDHPLDKSHAKNVLREYGIEIGEKVEKCSTVSDLILVLGGYFGVDGFIGPANKPDVLANYRRLTDKKIFAPGIGRQGDIPAKYQLERLYGICGKNSAAIIGEDIYNAENPAIAAKQFSDMRDEYQSMPKSCFVRK